MKIKLKANGLYQIDDITMNDFSELFEMIATYNVVVHKVKSISDKDNPDFKEMYKNFMNALEKATTGLINFGEK